MLRVFITSAAVHPFFLAASSVSFPKSKICCVSVSSVFPGCFQPQSCVSVSLLMLRVHFNIQSCGTSRFITSDLGLLQNLTAVLLLQSCFPSWSVGLCLSIFLLDYKQVSSFSFIFFCPGCDYSQNPLKIQQSVELIDPDWRHEVLFHVCVLENVSLSVNDCRLWPF